MEKSNLMLGYQKILIIILIFINILNFNCSFVAEKLKIDYFKEEKKLIYVNAFNNLKGDLYFEFWGEDTNIRYFKGLNITNEKDLYINGSTLFSINSNYISIHHDSAIIYDSNNTENIFSMNYKYFEYINIEGNDKYIGYKNTDDIIFKNTGADPSFRNSIIKLKSNNYYLLSLCLINGNLIKTHKISFIIFNFTSDKIDGFKQVSQIQKTISRINSTDCFQTESEYIQCSFTNVLPSNLFHIGIYDLNMNEKNTISFNYIKDNTFTKIFHIKEEIGAYIYYDDRDCYNGNPIPKIHIKKLDDSKSSLSNVFGFEYIPLHGNGNYAFNTELYFSDAIKVNDSKIVVVMMIKDQSNLLFCILDLYYDKYYVRVKYYLVQLTQINVKISINLHLFKFKNYFGCVFYNSNEQYSGYFLLNYPNITSINKVNYNEIEIKIFEGSQSYSFGISENLEFVNNIYGGEEKIKIINFDKSSSGIILSSYNLNNEISIDDEISISDKIIFQPSITGAVPGEYILEFCSITIYSDKDSIADLIEYYPDDEYNEDLTQIITDEAFKIIYKVECFEKCETCRQLGNEDNYYCVKCKNTFPYNINNGEKCLDECPNFIYIDENEKIYCIENCDNEHFKYLKNDNEKYCLSSCIFNNEELFLDSENKICYESCSESTFNKIYTYQKECVEYCPTNYTKDSNNICVLIEEQTEENEVPESDDSSINNIPSIVIEDENSESDSTINNINNIPSTIIKDENSEIMSTINNLNNNPSSILENLDSESENIINYPETTIIYDKETIIIPSTIIDDEESETDNIETDAKTSSINDVNIIPSTIIHKEIHEDDTTINPSTENESSESNNNDAVENESSESNNNDIQENESSESNNNDVEKNESSESNNNDVQTIIDSSENIENEISGTEITFDSIINTYINESSIDVKKIINNFITKKTEFEMEKDNKNNLTYYCYSSKSNLDTMMNLNSNLTYLNLRDCERKLIQENNLDENSDLLILGIESPNILENSSVNNFNYEIYTREGERISNLSVCENIFVELSTPIINLNLINYEKALYLFDQGYDIFNLDSDFYFDVCTSAYINNSDLTLNVRREDIFPNNISFCQSGCKYDGVDLENKRFLCLCNSDLSKNIEINENDEIIEEVEGNFFTYIIDMINYKIIICHKLLMNKDNYFYNYGFYVGFCINFMIIILAFVYCCQGKKSIKLKYLHNEPKMEEIKKMERNFNNQTYKYKTDKNDINNINDKSGIEGIKEIQRIEMRRKNTKRKAKTHVVRKKKTNIIKPNSNPTRKKIPFKRKTSKNKTKKKNTMIIRNNFQFKIDIHKDNKYNNSNSNLFVDSNENIIKGRKKSSDNNLIQKSNINKSEKNSIQNNEINQIEYNELTYIQALRNDERNVFQMFISYFNIKLDIIQIIFFPKEFSHKSLTFSLYLFELLLDLTINSLLFSDDVISQKYYDNGELKLLTTNILSISSNIISNFILFLIEKLINYYDILNEITRDIKNTKDFYKIFIKISCIIEFKIKLFFIFVFLIGIFCTYYLFIFCAIYKKIQKNLFVNYIVGKVWSLSFTLGICLIITIIRKIALVNRYKRLYLISKYIDQKF